MIAGIEIRYSGNGYGKSWPANCKCDQKGRAALRKFSREWRTESLKGRRKIEWNDIEFNWEKTDDCVEQSDDGSSGGARRPETNWSANCNEGVATTDHRLFDSASPVLTMICNDWLALSMGNGNFRPPTESTPPQPITKKFVTGDYVGDPYACAKYSQCFVALCMLIRCWWIEYLVGLYANPIRCLVARVVVNKQRWRIELWRMREL